jgi:hypothetical protein
MQEQAIQQRCFKVSRIENRIPNFNALHHKPGSQRLLLYNGSGGYGDQIMTWPFARILASYGFEIHILNDPGNQTCWWNFPWIKSIQAIPMQYEQFKMFDYWCLMEAVVNCDEHQDQQHPLDVMLAKVGIDPNSIEPKLKVVRPNFTWLEMQSVNQFQGKIFGMYQLAAANPIRCLPPSDSVFLLSKLADAFPEIHWLALYDEFIPEPYRQSVACPKCQGGGKVEKMPEAIPASFTGTSTGSIEGDLALATATVLEAQKPVQEICAKCKGSGTIRPNIQLFTALALRDLWALATKAAVVVAPDSMMVHVAGSMDVPCVGLWGPCNPANRAKYYKNHFAVWKREACPFAPCFAYGGAFPRYCPPRTNRTVCECLGAVAPQEVIDAVKPFVTPQKPT